jgi:hypothetical protein
MKKFRDVRTGVVETVTNEKLIKQYEKHSEIYEEIKDKKADTKKADKVEDNKDAE